MKKPITVALAVLVLSSTTFSDRFSDFWYDGNAEISTYEIEEIRYGELRKGTRIMVYVTEPMRLSTHIKPDVRLPQKQKIEVIKLNDLRKFTTGIYDYSVMTSVFSAVEEKKTVPLFGTMKVAFTSQEWCGTVFERLVREKDEFRGSLFSYFESEGEHEYRLPHGRTAEAEENLWIIIRELRGPRMEPGESRSLRIIPSTWYRRKAHTPVRLVEGRLSKGQPVEIETKLGRVDVVPFVWDAESRVTTVYVENSWPRRILAWKESNGSSGKLLATSREPYWEQNKSKFEYLRDKLNLSMKD